MAEYVIVRYEKALGEIPAITQQIHKKTNATPLDELEAWQVKVIQSKLIQSYHSQSESGSCGEGQSQHHTCS